MQTLVARIAGTAATRIRVAVFSYCMLRLQMKQDIVKKRKTPAQKNFTVMSIPMLVMLMIIITGFILTTGKVIRQCKSICRMPEGVVTVTLALT